MPDLIPEGYISLVDAFELYKSWLWGGHEPFTELEVEKRCQDLPGRRRLDHRTAQGHIIDAELDGFVGAFKSGRLEALLRPPGSSVNFIIPRSAWTEAHFPQRLFLSNEILGTEGAYFAAATGRTAFTLKSVLNDLLRLSPPVTPDDGHELQVSAAASLRSFLIDLANDGVVKPAEAEKFAKDWQLGRFEREPGPKEFDPVRHAAWTLPMTVVWIAWRRLDQVRQTDDAYRAECRKWFSIKWTIPADQGYGGHEVSGSQLRTLGPRSFFELGVLEAITPVEEEDPPKIVSVKTARQEIWRQLGEGDLVASAIDQAGHVAEVPSGQWPYLELAFEMEGSDYLVWTHDKMHSVYSRVTFPRKRVLELWPLPRSSEVTPPPTAEAVAVAIREPRPKKLKAAIEAVAVVFPRGIPMGLTAKDRLNKVNEWLSENGHSTVGATTVLRALASE
jgi:hypothetical protein